MRRSRLCPILVLMGAAVLWTSGWGVGMAAAIDVGPDWLRIGKGYVNRYAGGVSRIDTNIAIRGELLDLKVEYPVIHHVAFSSARQPLNSAVTATYRIDEAILPTGPIEARHSWNAWILTKLPVTHERLQNDFYQNAGHPRFTDGVISSEGNAWKFKGVGEYTQQWPMKGLRNADKLTNGLYGIARIEVAGTLVDPDNPGVTDSWDLPRSWVNSVKFLRQMTILLADLSRFEAVWACEATWTPQSPWTVRLRLRDATGAVYPIPNAVVRAAFRDARGASVGDVDLQAEWEDDPVSMIFLMPTGRHVTACPSNAAGATVTAAVGIVWPSGRAERVVFTNELSRTMP